MKKLYYLLSLVILISNITKAQTQPKLGYGISPVGFPITYDNFPQFIDEVSNTCNGGVMHMNGSWRNSFISSGDIPKIERDILPLQPSPYNFTDLSVYGWASYPVLYLDHPNNATNNWTNSSTKASFLKMLISTADSLSPTYLMIGNEVSFYWEQDSVDFLNFAAFYSMAYDSIKAHSPTTKVGTVFNYEHLSGKGHNVNWNTPYWNALLAMDTSKMDVLGITLYPFLSDTTANDIPLTYLDGLFNRIGNIPVVFTETGWPADDFGAAWTASPQQQVDYVDNLFNMINNRNVEIVNWLFLNYYMEHNFYAFKSVALRDSLGNDQPALASWLSHCPSATSIIKEKNNSQWQCFPNPSEGIVNFRRAFFLEKTRLTVYDCLGKKVIEKNIASENSFDINLQKGIYYYQLRTESNNQTGKIVIQ